MLEWRNYDVFFEINLTGLLARDLPRDSKCLSGLTVFLLFCDCFSLSVHGMYGVSFDLQLMCITYAN